MRRAGRAAHGLVIFRVDKVLDHRGMDAGEGVVAGPCLPRATALVGCRSLAWGFTEVVLGIAIVAEAVCWWFQEMVSVSRPRWIRSPGLIM